MRRGDVNRTDVDLSIFDTTDAGAEVSGSAHSAETLSIFDTTDSEANPSHATEERDDVADFEVISWDGLVEIFAKAKSLCPEIDGCAVVLQTCSDGVLAEVGFCNAERDLVKAPQDIQVHLRGCRFDDRLSLRIEDKRKTIIEL